MILWCQHNFFLPHSSSETVGDLSQEIKNRRRLRDKAMWKMQADAAASSGPQDWTGSPPSAQVCGQAQTTVLRPQGQSTASEAGHRELISPPTHRSVSPPSPFPTAMPWDPGQYQCTSPNGGSSCFLGEQMRFVRSREPKKEVCLFPFVFGK